MMLRTRPRATEIDNRLASVPLFEACNRAEIQTLRRLGETVTVAAGAVLGAEADIHARFHAVLSGEVAVHRFGQQERVLASGDIFGALETLRHQRMPATLIATQPSQVFIVGPREFAGLVDEIPGLARRLLLSHAPQRSLTVVGKASLAPARTAHGPA